MNKPKEERQSRRKFLLAMGAGGAAATTALVVKNNGHTENKTVADDSQGKGYRLTEHIRNYYRTTQV